MRAMSWFGVRKKKKSGYVHLKVKPIPASEITIRLKGSSKEDDAFGQIVEVAAPVANELDLFKAKDGDKTNHELRIVEVEFKETWTDSKLWKKRGKAGTSCLLFPAVVLRVILLRFVSFLISALCSDL